MQQLAIVKQATSNVFCLMQRVSVNCLFLQILKFYVLNSSRVPTYMIWDAIGSAQSCHRSEKTELMGDGKSFPYTFIYTEHRPTHTHTSTHTL